MKIGKGLLLVIAISLTFVGLLLISLLAGYRYFSVVSPSMGETAPVGSLVITLPKEKYSVNDIVSFHRGSRIYTHRIIEVNKDGNYITKGDLNDVPDALFLTHNQIIGSSVFIAKYLGWLWRGLPLLAIGFAITYFLSLLRKIKDPWRWPVRIIGFTLTVMIVTVILNPWVRVDLLHYHANPTGGVDMRIVNTGVFPIRDSYNQRFYTGQTAQIHTDDIDDKGRFVYFPRPALGFWGVIFALLWCLTPLFLSLLVKLPLSDQDKLLSAKEIEQEKRRGLIIFTIVTTTSTLILLLQLSTMAAFTAVINNSNNTATVPAREYNTCRQVMNGISSPKPLFAYAMDATTNWLSLSGNYTIQNISGNNQAGYYNHRVTNGDLDSNVGCVRDTPVKSTIFNGTSRCLVNRHQYDNPSNFSIEVWFKTDKSGVNNGKIVGFGGSNSSTNISEDNPNDRNVYLDKDGRVVFGVYPGLVKTIASPIGKNYADNKWHHMVATLSSSGMKLYLDGRLTGESANNSAQNYAGYWKFGCGRMLAWQHGDGSQFDGREHFNGQLQYGAVYSQALSSTQVWQHYLSGSS